MFDILKKKIASLVSGVSKNITKEVTKKVVEKTVSEKDVNPIIEDMELSLLEADVAFEVSEKIKEGLRKDLVGSSVRRGKVKQRVENSLKTSLEEILDVPKADLNEIIKKNKPCLLLFLGFNGSGKTTSLAKIGNHLKKKGFTCVFAAADTFRAASIEQLQEHADKLKIKTVKHKYGADAAAVVYDAMEHAKAKGIDVVLADTAGRSHTDINLLEELKKICKVNKPNLKILVLDSLTGNDILAQCEFFDKTINVDALIFTKMDVNPKGGNLLSAAYSLKKPIIFLGNGQKYDDLEKYDPQRILERIIG